MVAVVLEATRGISEAVFALTVFFKRAYVNTYEFFEILSYKMKTRNEEKLVKQLAYALKSEYPHESQDYVEFLARNYIEMGKKYA